MQRERRYGGNDERMDEREEWGGRHRRAMPDFRGGHWGEREEWHARPIRDRDEDWRGRSRWEPLWDPQSDREYESSPWERDEWRDRDRRERGYGARREWMSRDVDREEGGLFHRMGEGIKNAFGMGDRERMRGPHFGKGPKGFKRSDERIREDVSEAIARQGWIDASDVEVKVQSGEVTLSGTIAHREHKRMLERMIEDLPAVVDVHNEIRVRRLSEGVGASGEAYDPNRGMGRNVRHS